MTPPFSVNIFVTSAWLIPQRSPSWNCARFATPGASPFSPFTGFPPAGGGVRLSGVAPFEEPELLFEEVSAVSSVTGSGLEACFGSLAGPHASTNARTRGEETRTKPRFMDLDGNTRPHPSPTRASAGKGET